MVCNALRSRMAPRHSATHGAMVDFTVAQMLTAGMVMLAKPIYFYPSVTSA